jgi:hypothetical protein
MDFIKYKLHATSDLGNLQNSYTYSYNRCKADIISKKILFTLRTISQQLKWNTSKLPTLHSMDKNMGTNIQ